MNVFIEKENQIQNMFVNIKPGVAFGLKKIVFVRSVIVLLYQSYREEKMSNKKIEEEIGKILCYVVFEGFVKEKTVMKEIREYAVKQVRYIMKVFEENPIKAPEEIKDCKTCNNFKQESIPFECSANKNIAKSRYRQCVRWEEKKEVLNLCFDCGHNDKEKEWCPIFENKTDGRTFQCDRYKNEKEFHTCETCKLCTLIVHKGPINVAPIFVAKCVYEKFNKEITAREIKIRHDCGHWEKKEEGKRVCEDCKKLRLFKEVGTILGTCPRRSFTSWDSIVRIETDCDGWERKEDGKEEKNTTEL